jgi:activating signal cointegrator complex subunit 2
MPSAPPAHQSKPTNHHRRNPHNYHDQRQPPPPPPQQQPRYVPKSAAAPKPSPQPSLTAALRSSAASSPASSSGGGGAATDAFVAYLPHDEAVAAGLGGLDAQESQAVVDVLNDALAALLRAPPREFWRQGNGILSLIEPVSA